MLRNLLIGLAAVVAAAALGFWWLMVDARAPASAPGRFDIAAWRALVANDQGAGPDEIRWIETGSDTFPRWAVEAGDFSSVPGASTYGGLQLVYANSTIVVGGGVDEATFEEIRQGPDAAFDAAAYETLLQAAAEADLALMTHEHLDHVMAIARHPQPDEVAPHLLAPAAQLAALPAFTISEAAAAAYGAVEPFDLDEPRRIAPGVVVSAAAGHSSGSLVVYVQTADGEEALLIGDIVWHMSNLDTLKTRPRLLQLLFFDPPEDRPEVLAQVRALHDLREAEPDPAIIPSHDRAHLQALEAAGRITAGFVLRN